MFKLAEQAEGLSRVENALLIKDMLEALKEVIPRIRKMEVCINHAEALPDNYDILLDSEFDSLEDLNAYALHPEHLKVGDYIVKARTGRAAIDYEINND